MGIDPGYLRVLSGLLDGEEIVTSAQFMLDSESRLQEAIQKMLNERQAMQMEDTPVPMTDSNMEHEAQDSMPADGTMDHQH